MKIVVIDFENEHGYVVKKILQSVKMPFIWEKIATVDELPDIIDKYKKSIYCLPLAWSQPRLDIKELFEKYNSIVIAAKDEELLYPWSWANIVADYPITWITKTENVSGTSAACAFKAYKEGIKHGTNKIRLKKRTSSFRRNYNNRPL